MHNLFLKITKVVGGKKLYTLVFKVQNVHILFKDFQKLKCFSDGPIKETHCKEKNLSYAPRLN
jgi:hypothetical protein